MDYTREKLEAMSDFEVNEVLATLGCDGIVCHAVEPDDGESALGAVIFDGEEYIDRVIDYCNNWNDVMPLALDKISLMQKYGVNLWEVESNPINGGCYCYKFSHEKLPRAITCCLILTLQGEL